MLGVWGMSKALLQSLNYALFWRNRSTDFRATRFNFSKLYTFPKSFQSFYQADFKKK